MGNEGFDMRGVFDRIARSELNVLVYGDTILDRTIYGTTDRANPEGPWPLVKVTGEKWSLGGAGYVARLCKSLGAANVDVRSSWGWGSDGDRVNRLFKESGVRTHCQSTGGDDLRLERSTVSVKTRLVSESGGIKRQISRYDRDRVGNPYQMGDTTEFEELISSSGHDLVLIADYGKGVCDSDTVTGIISLCNEYDVPVMVDPYGTFWQPYSGATLIKPNTREFRAATGNDPTNDTIEAAATKYDSDFLVTMGFEGMTYVAYETGTVFSCRPDPDKDHQPSVDVTGAGDSAFAAVGLAYASGCRMPEAVSFASRISREQVRHFGCKTLHAPKADNWSVVGSSEPNEHSYHGIAALARRIRRSGRKIVFTNGCFDLFHKGHAETLKHIYQLCREKNGDLIVSINSDASVRRLKGDTRPSDSESTRIDNIRLHAEQRGNCNVWVFLEDGDNSRNALALVKPDYFLKGGTTPPESIEGRDLIESYGGEIQFGPVVPGVSTTKLLAGDVET